MEELKVSIIHLETKGKATVLRIELPVDAISIEEIGHVEAMRIIPRRGRQSSN